MDGTFISALKVAIQAPVQIGDRLIVPSGWSEAIAPPKRVANTLAIATLTGIRDYLAANVDGLDLPSIMLHVVNEREVAIVDELEEEAEFFRRQVYVRALADSSAFPFGQFVDAEMFNVLLQTQFVPTASRDEILTLIASIRDSAVSETVDDGVKQEVKTARGPAFVDRTPVPNPVGLRPYRTFREVEQPVSAFVLRLRSGDERPGCALFEADGGAWKLQAINYVATWLRANVGGVSVIG